MVAEGEGSLWPLCSRHQPAFSPPSNIAPEAGTARSRRPKPELSNTRHRGMEELREAAADGKEKRPKPPPMVGANVCKIKTVGLDKPSRESTSPDGSQMTPNSAITTAHHLSDEELAHLNPTEKSRNSEGVGKRHKAWGSPPVLSLDPAAGQWQLMEARTIRVIRGRWTSASWKIPRLNHHLRQVYLSEMAVVHFQSPAALQINPAIAAFNPCPHFSDDLARENSDRSSLIEFADLQRFNPSRSRQSDTGCRRNRWKTETRAAGSGERLHR